MLFDYILRKHNTLYFNVTCNNIIPSYLVKAFNHELLNLGYICTTRLLAEISKLSTDDFYKLKNDTIESIKDIKGIRRHIPLYPGFPNVQNIDMDDDFKKIVHGLLSEIQLESGEYDLENSFLLGCGHLINRHDWNMSYYDSCPICGDADISHDHELKKRPALQEAIDIQILDYKDIKALVINDVNNLLASKTILSEDNINYLETLLDSFKYAIDTAINTETIPVKETAAIICTYVKNTPINNIRFIKTSTDLLRYLVSINHGDVSLLSSVHFGKFPRKLRREIVEFLDQLKLESLTEDLMRYKGLWKTIGKAIHVFEYKKYTNVISAFMVLRETKVNTTSLPFSKTLKVKNNKLIYQNFNSSLNKYFDDKNLKGVVSLLKTRPGEFARTIDRCLMHFTDYNTINTAFNEIVDSVSTPVLISLLNNLKTRKTSIGQRFISTKKGTIVNPDTRPTIKNQDLIDIIDISLKSRFKADNVLVDERLMNIVLPLSERKSSKQLVSLPVGSRIDIGNKPNIRLFLHWIESGYRTDLDLSVVLYDSSFNMKGYCDFTNLKYKDSVIHSGDFTSAPAPNGASEFIDMNKAKLLDDGIRYIASEIYSYSNTIFDDLNGAMVGFMLRDDTLNGEVYDPRLVADKFDLTGNSLIRLPYLIDLKDNVIIWIDSERKIRIKTPSVANASLSLSSYLETFLYNNENKMTIYDIANYADNVYTYNNNKYYLNGKETDISDINFDFVYMYDDKNIEAVGVNNYSLYRNRDVKYSNLINQKNKWKRVQI